MAPSRAFGRAFALALAGLAATPLPLGCGGSAEPGAAGPSADDGDADDEDGVAAVLAEIERLAFVPAGRTGREVPLRVGSDIDLLVDRFEVTWALWDASAPDPGAVPEVYRPERRFRSPSAQPAAWIDEVPVVGVTLAEADACAAARGMRLPTFEEWMWCAIGPQGRRSPSGRTQVNLANTLEVGVHRPLPVGSFEGGRTPDGGLYDMLGNVWEWVHVPVVSVAADWSVINMEAWAPDRWQTANARWMGGSFLTTIRALYTARSRDVYAFAASPGHRASDVGFRCVTPARAYLAGLPNETPDDDERRRLRAIGERWGARAVPALDDALGATPGSALLLALRAGAEGRR